MNFIMCQPQWGKQTFYYTPSCSFKYTSGYHRQRLLQNLVYLPYSLSYHFSIKNYSIFANADNCRVTEKMSEILDDRDNGEEFNVIEK